MGLCMECMSSLWWVGLIASFVAVSLGLVIFVTRLEIKVLLSGLLIFGIGASSLVFLYSEARDSNQLYLKEELGQAMRLVPEEKVDCIKQKLFRGNVDSIELRIKKKDFEEAVSVCVE